MTLPDLEIGPLTDEDIRIYVSGSRKEPLKDVRETDDDWRLGYTLRICKHVSKYRDGYGYWHLYPGFHFYKRWFDFAETKQRGWAIIFKILPPTATPFHEWFVGWVPPERGAEAEGWITFLNGQIERRLAEQAERKKTEMTDLDHIRYMLDGGRRGEIERLWEMKDAWGFGGTLWLAKEHPAFKDGPMDEPTGQITQLTSHNRFEKTRFELADTGASGWAVWFIRGPRTESSGSLDNRSLCGWVPLEREDEVTGWIEFLNGLIAEKLAKVKAQWEAMTEDERREAASADHFAASMQFLKRVGLPVPEAANMDEFMDRLGAMAEDGPIDARSRPSGPSDDTKK